MSELTSALQTIFAWIEEYYPKFEKSFQPGLTYEEIKSYDDKLSPYYFTLEIYELYQWRNGTLYELDEEVIRVDGSFYHFDQGYLESLDNGKHLGNSDIDPFLILHFLPIEHIYFERYENAFENSNHFGLLHLFLHNSDGDELVCPEGSQEDVSPLMYSVTQEVHEEFYSSLTAKFLDLADSIKLNAYFFEDSKFGRILSIDTSKICLKRKTYINYEADRDSRNYIELGEWTFQEQLRSL